MWITKVVIGDDSQLSQVIIDEDKVLDGVRSFTIQQNAGSEPTLTVVISMLEVDIERVE